VVLIVYSVIQLVGLKSLQSPGRDRTFR
jgi:hypothetical protein